MPIEHMDLSGAEAQPVIAYLQGLVLQFLRQEHLLGIAGGLSSGRAREIRNWLGHVAWDDVASMEGGAREALSDALAYTAAADEDLDPLLAAVSNKVPARGHTSPSRGRYIANALNYGKGLELVIGPPELREQIRGLVKQEEVTPVRAPVMVRIPGVSAADDPVEALVESEAEGSPESEERLVAPTKRRKLTRPGVFLGGLIVVALVSGGIFLMLPKPTANDDTAPSAKTLVSAQNTGGEPKGEPTGGQQKGSDLPPEPVKKQGESATVEVPAPVPPVPPTPEVLTPAKILEGDLNDSRLKYLKLREKGCAWTSAEVAEYTGDLAKPASDSLGNYLEYLHARTGKIAPSKDSLGEWLLLRRVRLNAPDDAWTKPPALGLTAADIKVEFRQAYTATERQSAAASALTLLGEHPSELTAALKK